LCINKVDLTPSYFLKIQKFQIAVIDEINFSRVNRVSVEFHAGKVQVV